MASYLLLLPILLTVCGGKDVDVDRVVDFVPRTSVADSRIVFQNVVPFDKGSGGGSDPGGKQEETVSYNDTVNHLEMFENFQLTKKVFVKEITLRALLAKLRNLLRMCRDIEGERGVEKLLLVRDVKDEIKNITEGEFTREQDYLGAKKGLLLLQDTYHFDILALTKGKLISNNFPRGPLKFKNRHKLELEDFLQLTYQVIAVETKWSVGGLDFY